MTEPAQSQSQSPAPIRRFAVQPVETSARSNRTPAPKSEHVESNGSAPKRRFAPQLEETNERSHRKGGKGATKQNNALPEKEASLSAAPSSSGKGRFAPQLVETAKRSRKSGDTMPTMKHTDRTDLSPGDKVHLPRHMRLAEGTSPEMPSEKDLPIRHVKHDSEPSESRFSYSSLSKRTPRQSSFRVPQLEPIASPDESEESNESNVPSLSTTPSALSDGSEAQKQARRLRDSCDEKFLGYLLSLAARAAEKQLQEQALAAFPNERFHEPVNHFAFKRNGEDSDEDDFAVLSGSFNVADAMQRRMSATGWDLAETRRHKEKLEEQRRRQRQAASTPPKKENEVQDPWKSPFDLKAAQENTQLERTDKHIGGPVQDPGELTKMRSAASPPLLGKELKFVTVTSPKQTMIDATQRPRRRSRKVDEPESRQHSGLWTPGGGPSPAITRKNSISPCSPALWGGFCNGPDKAHLAAPQSHRQTGVMTPRPERENAFDTFTPPSSPHQALPSSPPPGAAEESGALDNIDAVLNIESTLDEEFPDAFVTQLYNYLSLGYPALAWKFDLELSKISRIPLEEIRSGDKRTNTKGYVGAPEGEGWQETEVKENCGRWFALRLYVREWARQQPKMAHGGKMEWGQRARRGSWAI